MMLTIVDYGMGNLGSIINMFKKIGVETNVVSDRDGVSRARKLVLPGVGAFDAAMSQIEQRGLRGALNQKALEEKIPILGICLGMQLLTLGSEEGKLPGLGWIRAKTVAFKGRINTCTHKIPHMGWNVGERVVQSQLTEGFEQHSELRFYFVHSFHVQCEDEKKVILRTKHGITFDSAIQDGNIYGAQFHPEKSHKFGMKFLANFARL